VNSSISNSRTLYLKILLVILFGMGCSMALVRLVPHLAKAKKGNFWGRISEARQALPRMTSEPKPLVMVFGSSLVREGFSPRQFQNELNESGIDVEAYNFGFGGLNPLLQEILARRVKEHFQAENRRLSLAIVEFNPFQATQTRRRRVRAIEDSFLAMVGSPAELSAVTVKDPERGVRLLNIRYLRDGISAEMITSQLQNLLREPPGQSQRAANPVLVAKRKAIELELKRRMVQAFPANSKLNWSYEWRGWGPLPEEMPDGTGKLYAQYYRLGQMPYRMDNNRLRRIHTADIIELNFDRELISAFLEIIEHFKVISDRVEIVLFPRNAKWIQRPPDAEKRLKEVIAYITRESGVPVRDYQNLETVTPEMFDDVTHLSRYEGTQVFTSYLANQYRGVLSELLPNGID